jgi:hypothetical protein
MRRTIAAGAVVLLTACGRDSVTTPAPTPTPTPTPTPAPQGFVLRGMVWDTAYRPLDQARIEAMDGPQAGAVTTSNAQGQFSFSQSFTQGLTLRASKDGYVTAQQSVMPLGYSSPFYASFTLASPMPSLDLTGSYVVTVTADAACTTLPPNTVSRSYTATINRRSSRDTAYIGRLGGAAFATGPYVPYDSFVANVFGSFVNFGFWNLENDEMNGVVEQLGPEAYLGIRGEAGATFEGDSIDVPFSGLIAYCPGARVSPSVFVCAPATPCDSKNHRLTVRRQ